MRTTRIANPSTATEWVNRIARREESWEEKRPEIFKEVVSLKSYPESEVCVHCYVNIHAQYNVCTLYSFIGCFSDMALFAEYTFTNMNSYLYVHAD